MVFEYRKMIGAARFQSIQPHRTCRAVVNHKLTRRNLSSGTKHIISSIGLPVNRDSINWTSFFGNHKPLSTITPGKFIDKTIPINAPGTKISRRNSWGRGC